MRLRLLAIVPFGVLSIGSILAAPLEVTMSNEPPSPTASPTIEKTLGALQSASDKKPSEVLTALEGIGNAARQAGDGPGEAQADEARARILNELNRIADAETAWQEAQAVWDRAGDGPERIGALVENALLIGRAEPDRAERLVTDAVSLAKGEQRRPRAAARKLVDGGDTAWAQRLTTLALMLGVAALALEGKWAPDSLAEADALNLLGILATDRGELAAALKNHTKALELRQKLAPNSLDVAASLNNLANVAKDKGDLSYARDYYLRALVLQKRLAPNSLDVAGTLNNLGNVAESQGDLSGAQDFYQRALCLKQMLTPNSLDVAGTLNNLGSVARDQGDLSSARDYVQRALDLRQKLAPNSLDVADSLSNIGVIARRQGDLSDARDYVQRALDLRQKLAPNSLILATIFNNLGTIAHSMGTKTHDPMQIQEAVRLARCAWDLIQHQAGFVAGDEARQSFDTSYADYASRLSDYQIELGRIDDAFATLEQGRAQALQQLLAERDITQRLVPSTLWNDYQIARATQNGAERTLEQAVSAEARAQAELDAEKDQLAGPAILAEKQTLLAAVHDKASKAQEEYTRARVDAEGRWSSVKRSISQVIPPPLVPAQALSSIPSDTLIAEFSLLGASGVLFLIERDHPISAIPLHMTLKELEARVAFVRKSVSGDAGGRAGAEGTQSAVRDEAARTLYRLLFPPEARTAVTRSKRLVISPDGPLWELPFAALVTNESGPPTYLGLTKPLTYAQSLTLFVQSLCSPVIGAGPLQALVVGNPLLDPSQRKQIASRMTPTSTSGRSTLHARRPAVGRMSSDRKAPEKVALRGVGELALLSRDGTFPDPLPGAEKEARQVARLYGVSPSIGPQPTEAWFRQHAGQADVIHLATHGYFNPFRAMSSGIYLAVPEKSGSPADTDHDGALEAWEIASELKLRADLVVLSACQTGLGAKVRGEGLVGLTRAFQIAGARSIVASQWTVEDESAAALMVKFHEALRGGVAKDEALRRAMEAVAKTPGASHPYFWAGFVLIGDPNNLRLARHGRQPRSGARRTKNI